MYINIDLAETIEVIEEKTQLEKEAFDAAFAKEVY